METETLPPSGRDMYLHATSGPRVILTYPATIG